MTGLPAPKKSLGQHWLDDIDSLEAMVVAANVQPDDIVLEIGPGPGALTQLLTEQAKQVTAVEFDAPLAAQLSLRVPAHNLEVIQQDILQFDFTSMAANYKLVANIPYYLTSNLIRVISETSNPPQQAAILIQKEVAERVAAAPGAMSLLSVTAQFYWEVSLGRVVPATAFTPPPKVDSQILILKRRTETLYQNIDAKQYFRLVKAGFSQRRKTLLNSLSGGLQLAKPEVQALCQATSIDASRRAQTLSLDEWFNLYRTLYQ